METSTLSVTTFVNIFSLYRLSFVCVCVCVCGFLCSAKVFEFDVLVLEKTLESPLDSKEIKPVNPKEKQP